ncbi:MAG: CopG family transcriptional regulator [Bacteroidales bacterium]|nr:CopG family transcriptional regulator [Bacteroidales bacterium]
METIKANIGFSDKNYSCGWGYPGIGVVMATSKTFDGVKKEFVDALDFHIEGMLQDGEEMPQWLLNKDYEIVYELSAGALIRQAEEFTTMAAISRATGINQKQLSHYANGTKEARPAQRARIVEGLHKIGRACMALY